MNRDGNAVAESMVVQDIDGEEENDIDHPPPQRNSIRLQKEGRSAPIELCDISRDGYKDELHKREQGACDVLTRACAASTMGEKYHSVAHHCAR